MREEAPGLRLNYPPFIVIYRQAETAVYLCYSLVYKDRHDLSRFLEENEAGTVDDKERKPFSHTIEAGCMAAGNEY
jgi:hypothetical protein